MLSSGSVTLPLSSQLHPRSASVSTPGKLHISLTSSAKFLNMKISSSSCLSAGLYTANCLTNETVWLDVGLICAASSAPPKPRTVARNAARRRFVSLPTTCGGSGESVHDAEISEKRIRQTSAASSGDESMVRAKRAHCRRRDRVTSWYRWDCAGRRRTGLVKAHATSVRLLCELPHSAIASTMRWSMSSGIVGPRELDSTVTFMSVDEVRLESRSVMGGH